MQSLEDKNLIALVSLLSDDDFEVLNHVENQILTLGGTLIPYLENEWQNNLTPPHVQKRIEDLIHTLQFEQVKIKILDWKNSPNRDILEGFWILSTYQYPDLDFEKIKAELEQIFYEVWVEIKITEDLPFDKIKAFNNAFFNKMKFTANTKNFHSINNSMLNLVLETRKGNPISLCIIYMLIAQKLKMPVYGVNLPNLFILTYKTPDLQFYINAFNKGLIFTKEDISNYVSHLNIKDNDIFYEPCNNLDIIRRVLRNMMVSYDKVGNNEKLDEVKQIIEFLKDETDAGF
ncbi:MAG: hypothetical protein EAZ27_00255 [Cytophagales bacterium]|nr:MAG: hypothetical protein EAZ27_00255 [Cytophagales bacterium]